MKEEKELITDNHSWRIGKNGRIHRRRRKVFPNGDVYNCEFVDNRPDGYGTLVTSKGMKYEGSFQNGLFHGPGTIILNAEVDVNVDGKVEKIEQFVGEFKHGKKHGYGTLHRYLDGEKWEGYFMDDVLNGKGSFWRASTGEHRKGTWHNGILHCEDGSIIFENGDTYNGPVFLGKMHGDVGHYTYAGNQGYYTGQHQRNTKEGIGTRHFCDGSTFRGDFKNGQMSGHGSFTYENGLDSRDRYIGDWKDGLIKGMGNCISKIFVMFHITKGTSIKACLVEKGIYIIEMEDTMKEGFMQSSPKREFLRLVIPCLDSVMEEGNVYGHQEIRSRANGRMTQCKKVDTLMHFIRVPLLEHLSTERNMEWVERIGGVQMVKCS